MFAPGHLGELTQVIDCELVDAVAAETGTVQKRVRLLPTRVVIFFVLALALFEDCGYLLVWGKLTASFRGLVRPSASGLTCARRRVGPKPLAALFEAVSGPVGQPGMPGVWWRGLRMVAVDGTCLRAPDTAAVTAVYRKRRGAKVVWGYPLLRLSVLVECGTRALLGAVFGPDTVGEKAHACRLARHLRDGMLLLADAGYDSGKVLAQFAATGAQWLCRSGASRHPLIGRRLPDGSYLSVLTTGAGLIDVRVIEASVTVTYADGSTRTQQWRLISSLLDDRRYPAGELIDLYHQRWEIETTYYSIKHSMLDGRVLRSQRADDIEQETWALLTVYQAIIRISVDAVAAARRRGLDPDRISFTIAAHTARDQVIAAAGILTPDHHPLTGAIGEAVLSNPLPPRRRRIKARTKKIATSKYKPAGTVYPRTTISYTLHTQIMIMEEGLTARSNP